MNTTVNYCSTTVKDSRRTGNDSSVGQHKMTRSCSEPNLPNLFKSLSKITNPKLINYSRWHSYSFIHALFASAVVQSLTSFSKVQSWLLLFIMKPPQVTFFMHMSSHSVKEVPFLFLMYLLAHSLHPPVRLNEHDAVVMAVRSDGEITRWIYVEAC